MAMPCGFKSHSRHRSRENSLQEIRGLFLLFRRFGMCPSVEGISSSQVRGYRSCTNVIGRNLHFHNAIEALFHVLHLSDSEAAIADQYARPVFLKRALQAHGLPTRDSGGLSVVRAEGETVAVRVDYGPHRNSLGSSMDPREAYKQIKRLISLRFTDTI